MDLRDDPKDLSDDYIRHGLAELAKAIQWHSDQHHPEMVDGLHEIARNLADERDRRRRVARRKAAESTVNITDLLRLEELDEWPCPDWRS